ncbi:MAG: electron transfer flavoprotein subunit beta/FixA family protein [Ruminococcaceae bacterium]|nr:electron transfer flavoprotein subunit beta/FixA family protein [Oscillospiraceae bacterium]
MRIVVCVKQVPASNEVALDPKTNTIIRDSRNAVINPFDSHALEAGLQIKDQLGAEVSVLSMGIPACEDMLRDCVSRGADQAMLLTDRAFAGADTLATSYALSKGVQALGGADLILCGKMAVDGDTAQIGPELAQRLGIPHVTDVNWIEAYENELIVRRELGSRVQTLRVPLPAVITVTRDLGVPRLPSIAGVLRSASQDILVRNAGQIGADPAQCGLKGSPTQVVKTFLPQRSRNVTEITGTTEEKCRKLIDIMKGVRGNGSGNQ